MEFTAAGGQPAAAISDAVTDVALELGLSANIVRGGASGGTMRIAPPLTVTDAEIDLGVELLDAAITRVVPAVHASGRPAGYRDTPEQGQAAR